MRISRFMGRVAVVVAVAAAGGVTGAQPGVAAEQQADIKFRCQLALVNASNGQFTTCNYTASSLNGVAVLSVFQGRAQLIVDCTVGGTSTTTTTVATRQYIQVGTCTAALIATATDGIRTTALADVGSTGL